MAVFAKIINIVEIGILLIAFGCGMAAAIMIGITTSQFGNQCVLKAGVEVVSSIKFLVHFSGYSRCNYCLIIQVVGLLLALLFGGYRVAVLCSGKYDIRAVGRLIAGILFGVLCFLLLVEACLVTVGLKIFCSNVINENYAATCRDVQGVKWEGNIDGSHFFDNLTAAEAASWISVLLWLTMSMLSLATYHILRRQPKTPPPKAATTDKTSDPI